MVHTHKWAEDGDCDSAVQIGGRVFACHARRCAALDCDHASEPDGDACIQHIARAIVARRRRLSSRDRHA